LVLFKQKKDANKSRRTVFRRYWDSFFRFASERRFLYCYYEQFLSSISDSKRYKNVPLRDFTKTNPQERIVISLRHDVDRDLVGALEIARIEHQYNLRSTFFILHTAQYYGPTKKNYTKHNERIIPVLQKMQNEYGHEIGWHNDLVTLECIYGINPREYLKKELQWLRSNGINIVGSASHGSRYCYKFKYHNSYFFSEFSETVDGFPNNQMINTGDGQCFITKASLTEFGLEYEAYHLNNNFYFSDSSFVEGKKSRWHPGELRLEEFKPGDKIIILIHPDHWNHSISHKFLKRLGNRTRSREAIMC
jgi:hypothetical protein